MATCGCGLKASELALASDFTYGTWAKVSFAIACGFCRGFRPVPKTCFALGAAFLARTKRSSASSEMLMMEFPEPLYETTYMQSRRMCLVCARKHAESVLRTTEKEIVPLCKDCASDWNAYGYSILKRIKPIRLIRRTLVFKILHPFQQPSLRTIWHDIKALQSWAEKMKKWM